MPKEEIDWRSRNGAQVLGLEPFLKLKPRALSGGQRQRVAMGRAIELPETLGSDLTVLFTVEGTWHALTEDVKELAWDAGAAGDAPPLESKAPAR